MTLNTASLRLLVEAEIVAQAYKWYEDSPINVLNSDNLVAIERDDSLLQYFSHRIHAPLCLRSSHDGYSLDSI